MTWSKDMRKSPAKAGYLTGMPPAKHQLKLVAIGSRLKPTKDKKISGGFRFTVARWPESPYLGWFGVFQAITISKPHPPSRAFLR